LGNRHYNNDVFSVNRQNYRKDGEMKKLRKMISNRCYEHRGGCFTGWSSCTAGHVKSIMQELYNALKENSLLTNYFVDLPAATQLSVLRQVIRLRDSLTEGSKEQKLTENCIKLMLDTRRISYDIVEIFENLRDIQALVDDDLDSYWDYC
jgi:hypothetical protein